MAHRTLGSAPRQRTTPALRQTRAVTSFPTVQVIGERSSRGLKIVAHLRTLQSTSWLVWASSLNSMREDTLTALLCALDQCRPLCLPDDMIHNGAQLALNRLIAQRRLHPKFCWMKVGFNHPALDGVFAKALRDTAQHWPFKTSPISNSS